MKKLILSLTVVGFAIAAQAGNDGACSEKAGSCCGAKPAVTETKAECPMAKQSKIAAKNSKATKPVANKQQLKSPKASAESRG